MSLDQRIHDEVKRRLIRDFALRDAGAWLRGGKCPKCRKKELFARAEKPRVLVCGRKDKCGNEVEVRGLYPEIFDDWSERTKDDPNPTAAADAYLLHVRGFDLQYLRGAYTQELYRDRKLNLTTATVRFPLPNGSWWERLIDQPDRFPKKANFAAGQSYQGHAWTLPGKTMADYAAAEEIWFVEGIFDAIALEQGDFRAARDPEHPVHKATVLAADQQAFEFVDPDDIVLGSAAPVENILSASLMSCYNYPEHFLRDLRIAVAEGPTPTRSPRLVFGLDLGAAGTEYTRKFVAQARKEGWTADAAQIRLEDEPGAKLDWNDLFLRDRLGHKARQTFRWAGDVLVAENEREKAFLIWRERKWSSFAFTFGTRTWWANFSEARIDERISEGFKDRPELSVADYPVKREAAARETCIVELIANCTFRALYFERNETTDTSAYWVSIDRPGDHGRVKASFPGPALAGSGEFKKRLISVASGAIWTGEQFQLDRMMSLQLPVRDVTGIEFTGYCRDHGVYVLGELAVAKGRVYRPNDDGFFDVGKTAIKLRTSERLLDRIEYDPDRIATDWLEDYWTAWGPKGLVVLTFMGGLALFAEQIREAHKSLGFLEVSGLAGSGKTTAIEFCWKLFGRDNYEGFDPAKSTQAGIARELAKVGNLPVVFIEGDRTDDVPHSKRFDWEETKTLFNGRATRTRGVKNDGLETYSPPFRGAFAIVQNEPVNASRAVLERIMALHFDKSGWSPLTKAAAERIENWPIEDVSGFIVHIARREAEIFETYRKQFTAHEKALMELPGVTNGRLAKNHAQLLGMLEALAQVLPFRDEWVEATRNFIRTMAVDRHLTISADHPIVDTFWERFEFVESKQGATWSQPINHARADSNLIAVRLVELEARCAELKVPLPPIAELRKHLKTSKRFPFVDAKPVNSSWAGTVHCWVFQRQPTPKS